MDLLEEARACTAALPGNMRWLRSLLSESPAGPSFFYVAPPLYEPESSKRVAGRLRIDLKRETARQDSPAHFERFDIVAQMMVSAYRAIDQALDLMPRCAERLGDVAAPALERQTTRLVEDLLALGGLVQRLPRGRDWGWLPDPEVLASHSKPLDSWIARMNAVLIADQASPTTAAPCVTLRNPGALSESDTHCGAASERAPGSEEPMPNAGKKKKRRRGRRPSTDPVADEKLYETWKASGMTKANFAGTQVGLTAKQFAQLVDRVQTRRRKAADRADADDRASGK